MKFAKIRLKHKNLTLHNTQLALRHFLVVLDTVLPDL